MQVETKKYIIYERCLVLEKILDEIIVIKNKIKNDMTFDSNIFRAHEQRSKFNSLFIYIIDEIEPLYEKVCIMCKMVSLDLPYLQYPDCDQNRRIEGTVLLNESDYTNLYLKDAMIENIRTSIIKIYNSLYHPDKNECETDKEREN